MKSPLADLYTASDLISGNQDSPRTGFNTCVPDFAYSFLAPPALEEDILKGLISPYYWF